MQLLNGFDEDILKLHTSNTKRVFLPQMIGQSTSGIDLFSCVIVKPITKHTIEKLML